MVVHLLFATVKPEKDGAVNIGVVVHELAREEVEAGRIELVRARKIGHAHAKMAQLVHRCRALLEPLESVHGPILLNGL